MAQRKLSTLPRLAYSNIRGFVPLASGFICGGVGLIPILTILPLSCCSGTYSWEVVLKSSPVPTSAIAMIGGVGLGSGAIALSGQRIRRRLKHDLWCGLMMMTLGVLMTGASGLIVKWIFGRGSWEVFAALVGPYGLFNIFLMLGLGIIMIILGFNSWKSRKNLIKCSVNQTMKIT